MKFARIFHNILMWEPIQQYNHICTSLKKIFFLNNAFKKIKKEDQKEYTGKYICIVLNNDFQIFLFENSMPDIYI